MFRIPEVSGGYAVDPAGNLRLCSGIRKVRQPLVKGVHSGAADVVANLNLVCDCNL
jgi:hypothetical protein